MLYSEIIAVCSVIHTEYTHVHSVDKTLNF
jgi:hypothetical protein